MTSKERIRKILDFNTPDYSGLPADTHLKVYSIEEALLKPPNELETTDKFTCLSFSEPFQVLCDTYGLEDTLRDIARSPDKLQHRLAEETDRILVSLEAVIEKGLKFDGAWAWGDLGYKDGLFFSLSFYREHLLPLHKKIFTYLASKRLYIFFHSDGCIDEIIPDLLDAGVRAFHPLDEFSGIDIDGLVQKYRDRMVFMGNIELINKIAILNKGVRHILI